MPSLPFQSTYSPPTASLAFSDGPGWSVAFTYDDGTKILTAGARSEITSAYDVYAGTVSILHLWARETQLKFGIQGGDAGPLAYTMDRDADSVDQTVTLDGVLSHSQWNEINGLRYVVRTS